MSNHPPSTPAASQPGTGTSGRLWGGFWLILFGGLLAAVLGIEAMRSGAGEVPNSRPSGAEPAGQGVYPRTVAGMDGPVRIAAKPQRIVSQTMANDEILLAICPLDRLVGTTDLSENPGYANYPEIFAELGRGVSGAEGVVARRPDLVLMASYNKPELVEQIRRVSDAPVLRFDQFDSIELIQGNIRKLGRAIGEEANAQALCQKMDRRIDRVLRIVASLPKPEQSPGVLAYSMDGFTPGRGTLVDDMLTKLGARNLAAEHGIEWFGQATHEKLAKWNPQILLIGVEPADRRATRRRLLADPVIATTDAGRTGRVHAVPFPEYASVSQNVVRAFEAIARVIHGEAIEVLGPIEPLTGSQDR